jgi:hypothetical protein
MDKPGDDARMAKMRARLERQERDKERHREQEMTSLRIRVAQHEGWRVGVENAARNTIRQQNTVTLLGELEKMLAPPAPPQPTKNPTEVVHVSKDEGSPELGDSNFDPALFNKKPRPWF